MNKFSVLAELYDGEIFDDSVAIVITIENGKLEVTPFGGTFKDVETTLAREAYGMARHLLESSEDYGGVNLSEMNTLEFVKQEEKH